jgi:uncharacterized protein YciI
MHFLLIYEITPDYMTRRAEFRGLHLNLAQQAVDAGTLVLGGAVGDPAESSLLLFKCASPEIPEAFAQADPYVLNGIVTRWTVKPWNTVVGAACANPVPRT